MNAELLSMLCCPHDRSPLTLQGSRLRCEHGHSYPVVDGVPVLLRDDVPQTIWMAASSLRRANDYADGAGADDWFIDTIGADETQRQQVEVARKTANQMVDPVASYLVGATNGILYRNMVGAMTQYPIPDIPLPKGNGRRLLDVGCSWGRWSIAASRKGYVPVGIDPSLGAVLAARRIARSMGVQFEGIVGDARFLPFRPGSFDDVFSYSVLQHFSKPDARTALLEVRRVLKPDGRSLIQMASAFGVRSLQHQVWRGFKEPKGFEVRYWTPGELLSVFREIFGRAEVKPDCYFGLGLQASDAVLLSTPKRLLVGTSEALKRAAQIVPPLGYFADSLYLSSGL